MYSDVIAEVLYEHPTSTYKDINNDVVEKEEIKQLNHAKSTSYGYVREVTKEDFGDKTGGTGKRGHCKGKVWCKRNKGERPIPLSDIELKNWKAILRERYENLEEQESDIIYDYKNGMISKAEMQSKVGDLKLQNYDIAEGIFFDRYGYWPDKVSQYELNTWDKVVIKKQ